MRVVKRVLIALAVVAISLFLAAATVYAVAGRADDGVVAPRVKLGNRDVGGLSKAELEPLLAEFARDLEDEPVVLRRADRSTSINTADFDLEVNQDKTARAVFAVGRDGSVFDNAASYLGSLLNPRSAPVLSSVDHRALERLLVTNDPGPRTPPTEPSLEFRDGKMAVVEGKAGSGLTAATVARELPGALEAGKPLELRPKSGAVVPTVEVSRAAEAARAINQRLDSIPVRVGNKVTAIKPEQYGPWISTAVRNGQFQYSVNAQSASGALPELLPEATVVPVEPRFVVNAGQPQIVPGVNGQRCCNPAAVGLLEATVERHLSGTPVTEPAELPVVVVPPVKTPEDLETLQIREPIGSFTTYHAPGQPRVTNIQRMADAVQGHVIAPGETMSLNQVVGRRTIEKGYVVDGVISEAKFAKSVGGGVSQFATTLFNAAFFGGLDFGQYQAHTIYIDRYPYGREATISHPYPDLQVKNTTPYGVLVWPTYTKDSITVTLYSTPHAYGVQTGQSETKAGECTRVRTERTRHYGDGRRDVDHVYALYQPAEGVKC